ncbi:MAG TPA: hypothetical protein RMH99_30660 [Sandaracinaceae bacterium LLY-WYZ-13_1]|nr:hypothetical protein [Sandaracinaceae bacterium LLY-WYZ-13_1]
MIAEAAAPLLLSLALVWVSSCGTLVALVIPDEGLNGPSEDPAWPEDDPRLDGERRAAFEAHFEQDLGASVRGSDCASGPAYAVVRADFEGDEYLRFCDGRMVRRPPEGGLVVTHLGDRLALAQPRGWRRLQFRLAGQSVSTFVRPPRWLHEGPLVTRNRVATPVEPVYVAPVRSPWLIVLAAAGALVACGEEGEGAPASTAEPTAEEGAERGAEALPEPESLPPPTDGQRHMHDRYDGIEAIRGALVRGDAEVARAVARGLDRPVSFDDLPASARGLRAVVPSRAREVAAATTEEDTAAAFARLVSGCGECHRAAEVTWRFDDHPAPEGEDLDGHMARHAWAVERMWEGLMLADPERFDRGARALEEAPLTGDEPVEDENPPGVSRIAVRIHARARDAREAADMAERAAIYGDLLGGCGACHARIAALDAEE